MANGLNLKKNKGKKRAGWWSGKQDGWKQEKKQKEDQNVEVPPEVPLPKTPEDPFAPSSSSGLVPSSPVCDAPEVANPDLDSDEEEVVGRQQPDTPPGAFASQIPLLKGAVMEAMKVIVCKSENPILNPQRNPQAQTSI